MRISSPYFSSLIAIATATLPFAPAAAQDGGAPLPSETSSEDDTIVVFGGRLLGQVDSPQPPILELEAADIAAYGAGSISELLEALGPQVSSARGRGGGRPVILVNGVRISSFRELRSYPPEAIEKMEAFPEETAQRYGYSADQRVVNFILKNNFSSREIETEYSQPWDGGNSSQQVEATYLLISGPSRLNFNFEWNNTSPLTEAERGIIQSYSPPLSIDPNPAKFRSLVGDSAGVEATANWTKRLDEAGTSLSANATYERSDSLSLQGLDSVLLTDPLGETQQRYFGSSQPLTVDNRSDTYSLGSTINAILGDWQITATLDGSHGNSTSTIRRNADPAELAILQVAALAGTLPLDGDLGALPDAGFETAQTKTDTASSLLTATTRPLYLPAGDVSLTLDAGFDWSRIQSVDTRNPGVETSLKRGDLTGGINLGIPLTSRDDDFLGAIGDFSLNLSAGLDHLSDFGTLYDWSTGLTWGLTDKLSFSATYLNRDSAPSLAQLGSPEIATPNVQVFDLARNETVLATVISGGNAFLPAQSQSDWKIGAAWDLPVFDRASLTVDYIRNSSTNVASSFPVLTPAIEAAFPGRVIRDGSGQIISLDQRPVSFASQKIERLQFGLNLNGPIGASAERGGGNGGRGTGDRGGVAAATSAPEPGGARRPGGRNADPARFAAKRTLLCGDRGAEVAQILARGESVTGPDGEDITLPARMLERMRGDNAEASPEQIEAFRTRMCSSDGPPAGGPAADGGAPPARGMRGFGRGGPGGGRADGRWFLNLQYTRELDNIVTVADGGPVLDLLNGGALSGGGQAQDAASFRLGVFYKGFGVRMDGAYTGSSTINGSGLPGSTDLTFDDYATVDVRMFVDLGQQASVVEKVPFLKNVRVSFDVSNIFDARQRVTDSSGAVPLRYQPFLIDPVGRSFEIEVRKLF